MLLSCVIYRDIGLATLLGLLLLVTSAGESKKIPSATTQDDGAYVGNAACSRCHAQIYAHFSQTGMGRSMITATVEAHGPPFQLVPKFLSTVPVSAETYEPGIDRHFAVKAEAGKLFQSEYQVANDGTEVFRNNRQIDWIIGANENGLGAITRRYGYLFEAPLSYYAKTGKWALSPGYQNEDIGFKRSIASGCIFCHSGRAQPVTGSDGKYQEPAFTQLAIGCENCHGPGSRHVAAMGEGESYSKGKDPTIVNPATLKPALANDICMSCHQTGDTRIFQPGKSYLDFRPGQPLDRILAILMIPPTKENPPREDHVEHYYSMILSKCYRASAANPAETQMRCITCHDPHVEPTSAEVPAYFNGKCLRCHTDVSCKAPHDIRAATAPADNCIGCHMQKREGIAISHTSMTNHRITARPDEPFPEDAFRMTTAALPDLVHLDVIDGESARPPSLTLLKAYGELKTRSVTYAAPYSSVLSELEKSSPENALVQAALGRQALEAGKLDEASKHLKDALKLNPMQAAVYADLSTVDDKQGDAAEAVAMARKAVALEPFNAPMQKALVLTLINAKRYAEAEAAMESYLKDFPEDDLMRKMLAIAKSP